jgi:hypothetical protein
MSFAVLRIPEWLAIASFPEATSRPSHAASTFSARISRVPPGTESASATHEIDPFWTPCEPAARTSERQRASRYSIDFPSDSPISASEPPPDVKRTLTPRDAYADARNAFDHGVSSPSAKTRSVPYTDSVSAYVTRPRIASRRFSRSSTAHCVSTPARSVCEPTRIASALSGA